MSRAGAAVAITAALVITFKLGSAAARTRRSWNDYQTTRRSIPGLRRGTFGLIGLTIRWGAGLVLVAALIVGLGRQH